MLTAFIAITILIAYFPRPLIAKACPISNAVDKYVAQLESFKNTPFKIVLSDYSEKRNDNAYVFVALLALRLYRKGYDFCFDDNWGFHFGYTLTCSYKRFNGNVRITLTRRDLGSWEFKHKHHPYLYIEKDGQ